MIGPGDIKSIGYRIIGYIPTKKKKKRKKKYSCNTRPFELGHVRLTGPKAYFSSKEKEEREGRTCRACATNEEDSQWGLIPSILTEGIQCRGRFSVPPMLYVTIKPPFEPYNRS